MSQYKLQTQYRNVITTNSLRIRADIMFIFVLTLKNPTFKQDSGFKIDNEMPVL
jgi:hypothetical protein